MQEFADYLAPLQGATNERADPEVSASLRPPATFCQPFGLWYRSFGNSGRFGAFLQENSCLFNSCNRGDLQCQI